MNNPPTVISLKGHIHEYGPSLEKGPPELLYIGRQQYQGKWSLPKSKWANPYQLKKYSREESLKLYRDYLLNNQELLNSLSELQGKVLCCWCFGKGKCHGDIL